MKVINVSTVLVQFYADKEGKYKNKLFSFKVKGQNGDEWEVNAKDTVKYFIKKGNCIRRAYLVINGTSIDLYDRIKVVNNKIYYIFD